MLETGQVLHDRYELQQKLGQNVGRQTWLAADLSTDPAEQVIVKLLTFGDQMQWEMLKLFEREAAILKQLTHPQIPQYRDYFAIDDRLLLFGLVHDYIPGKSLKELLTEGKRFTESQVRRVATEVLQILIYLHELNPAVLHRDIKPSNLILGDDRRIYLIDFGAVQDRATAEGSTFTVVGTYGYAPMEQFGGRSQPASDLYALGATLIHLLTGTAPAELPQRDLRIQFRDRVTLKSGLVSWIEQLTEPIVEKRWQSARSALEKLRSGLVVKPASQSLENNSGQGSVFDPMAPVPEEILGWNWGAFLLPQYWLFTNQVWLGLLSWIPGVGFIMAFFMGARGNQLAWQSRKWRSIQQFKSHQRGWTIAGLIFAVPAWMPYAFMLSRWVGSDISMLMTLAIYACILGGIYIAVRRAKSARS